MGAIRIDCSAAASGRTSMCIPYYARGPAELHSSFSPCPSALATLLPMSDLLSPWLHEVGSAREAYRHGGDLEADVCIVGGGIAGACTAHFTLRDTDKSVLLLEGSRIAQGATGHNAGQLVSYFERPLRELVDAYGLDMAARGQHAVQSSWQLIEQILGERGLTVPLYSFQGYAGLSTLDQILLHLENLDLRRRAGIDGESMVVAEDAPERKGIPDAYRHLHSVLPRSTLLRLIETNAGHYCAALVSRKGCMNSALFTEQLIAALLAAHPDRFRVVEGRMVRRVVLSEDAAELVGDGKAVKAKRVVLCTNGFEQLDIENGGSGRIDGKFHAMITGVIGYMGAYLQTLHLPPSAVSYIPKDWAEPQDAYRYVTRRPFEQEPDARHSLICVGGPERMLPAGAAYDRHTVFHEGIEAELMRFVQTEYAHPPHVPRFAYLWHGLMGYTPDGIRCVGPEPINPVLLYNVGCNGVGILPSVMGGKKIAAHLAGKHVLPTIFDPKDARLKDADGRLSREREA
jgi:glycine/D-amino acid oxidase-like deaminating enzyme